MEVTMGRERLTVAQATTRFLAQQWSERDGVGRRLVAGTVGIFGHGNVAGIAQALLEMELADPSLLPYHQARNEQAMVHTAAGFARMSNRLSTLACTTSIGPGATNMVTGAALATINRLPVLLLPSDGFATRASGSVLQQLEHPVSLDVSVNDAFRPVSRFFDRVHRPEQLPDALLGAMRVLADPAETGAVTIALPEDVQTEAYDFPAELFAPRIWHVDRPVPDAGSLARAARLISASRRPLVVAGGGVIYAEATEALRRFAEATGIPVGETQAGKGSLRYDHPQSVGALGATGTHAANELARAADVVIGIGTRWTDFTTASRTAFAAEGVRFVNVNITSFDAAKHAGVAVVGDARAALEALTDLLAGFHVDDELAARTASLRRSWDETVDAAVGTRHAPRPAQAEIVGAVNDFLGETGVVVCAAGSLPGELHKLWRCRDAKSYHVEYGYSCMGYEIAGGIGVKMAAPERDVCVLVGDGSYLMMAQELVTAVQERLHLVVVLVDNHGFASIGALSESVGSQRFGTAYRYRNPATGRLDGDVLPVDLAANAASLGVTVVRASSTDEVRAALEHARSVAGPVLVAVETDPLLPGPDSASWWDVPVAQVAVIESTREARAAYDEVKQEQRSYL
jgi:3D-(3,5/4)-trihydroxycyclohexane-1,2-dione acylhydrolase (decyclizing)